MNTSLSGKNQSARLSQIFLCRERKLVVEVDGATHSEPKEIAYDERRSRYLQALGYKLLRVQNADVFTIRDDVLNMILMALEEKL